MGDKKYKVRYFVEDNVVAEEYFNDMNEALSAAVNLDCAAFAEEDTGDCSLYAEVIRQSDRRRLLWANTEGERGSDTGFDVWKV